MTIAEYVVLWLFISFGLTLIIAKIFFGDEEKDEYSDEDNWGV